MFRKAIVCCAVALASLAPSISHADMTQIASRGAWTAYAGLSDQGQKLCTVSAQGGGRWFGMKYFAGDDKLTIHLMNNVWTGRSGLNVPLTAEFDGNGKWRVTAESFRMANGQLALEFNVPLRSIEQWLREFAGSQRLIVRFPDHRDVTDWSVSLDGSDEIASPLLTCIAATANSGASNASQRMQF